MQLSTLVQDRMESEKQGSMISNVAAYNYVIIMTITRAKEGTTDLLFIGRRSVSAKSPAIVAFVLLLSR